jgi:hypothetical protein
LKPVCDIADRWRDGNHRTARKRKGRAMARPCGCC